MPLCPVKIFAPRQITFVSLTTVQMVRICSNLVARPIVFGPFRAIRAGCWRSHWLHKYWKHFGFGLFTAKRLVTKTTNYEAPRYAVFCYLIYLSSVLLQMRQENRRKSIDQWQEYSRILLLQCMENSRQLPIIGLKSIPVHHYSLLTQNPQGGLLLPITAQKNSLHLLVTKLHIVSNGRLYNVSPRMFLCSGIDCSIAVG